MPNKEGNTKIEKAAQGVVQPSGSAKLVKPKGATKLKGLQFGVSEAELQRYYLRFLHGVGEKEDLQGLLIRRESAKKLLFYVREHLDKKQQKKLKKLLKNIKNNRKKIKTIRLAGLSVLITTFIIFNLFFKNKFVEWGIETGISALTGASVECDQAYLYWNGELGFSRLAVANPQDLGLNLVELGTTKFDISIWQLMLRKVVINEIRSENLRWNTRRETEGIRTKGSGGGESSFDLWEELSMAGLDPQLLFEQGKSQFDSLQAADKLQQELASVTQWPEKIEKQRRNIDQISQDIKGIELSNITVESLTDILKKGQALALKVEKLAKEVGQDSRLLDTQIRESSAAIDTINKNFESDLEKFKGQVANGSVLGLPISRFLQEYIQNKLSGIAVMSSIMTIFERFQQQGKDKKTNALKESAVQADLSRSGRNYPFPSTSYPSFVIKRIYFSLGTEDVQPYMRFEIKDITNDGDVMGYPIAGQYLGLDGGVKTEARFLLENRSEVQQVADCQPVFVDICQEGLQKHFAEFELSEQPFQLLADTFAKLQMPYIKSYDGKMRIELRLEQSELGSKGMRGKLRANIYGQYLQKELGLNLLQQTIASVLENNEVNVETSFELNDLGKIGKLQVETNIESILNREIRSVQQRAFDVALVEAEKLLREQLALDLGSIQSGLGDLQQYKKTLASQEKQVGQQAQFSSGLESQVNGEVEKKKKAAVDKVATDAVQQIEKVVNVPKSVPKLPF